MNSPERLNLSKENSLKLLEKYNFLDQGFRDFIDKQGGGYKNDADAIMSLIISYAKDKGVFDELIKYTQDATKQWEGKPKVERSGEKKEESPKIFLSKDRKIIEKLENKLLDYRQRLKKYEKMVDLNKSPEENFQIIGDTNYKIAVLEKLLREGFVDTHELAREINKKDDFFDSVIFNRACRVINDYSQTGGKNNYGGTGF